MVDAVRDPSFRGAAAEVLKYCREQALHECVVGLNVNLDVFPATGTLWASEVWRGRPTNLWGKEHVWEFVPVSATLEKQMECEVGQV